MGLFNLFSDLIEYTEQQKNEHFAATDFSSFKQEVEKRISTLNDVTTGANQEQLNLAKFAVYSWIDETIQRSQWAHKSQWQQELLQEQYFNTSNAGDIFFDNLEQFTEQDNAVVRVYFRCLALGFRGKYFREDDDAKLYEIKQHCLALMQISCKDEVEEKLCPELYEALENETDKSALQQSIAWYQHPSFKWLWPLGLLFVVFLFCYGVLYFTVHNYFSILS